MTELKPRMNTHEHKSEGSPGAEVPGNTVVTRVLIVDDEKSIRATLTAFLKEAGDEVHAAEDADEAQALLRQHAFDVVVSDIILPRVSGVELLHLIRQQAPEAQVIMMTGEPTVETAVEAIRAGANDYLTKPIGKQAILHAVQRAAQIKRLLDERRRLVEANQRYQQQLEELVAQRTEALRASERRYRLLVETSEDAILLTAPDGGILSANPAACRMFQRTEAEICRLGRAGVMDASDPRLGPALQDRAKTGRFRGELTFVRSDGQRFPGEVTSVVFQAEDGQLRTSMIIRDMSERERAQDQLRMLSRAVEQSPASVVITDPSGAIEYINTKFTRVTGHAIEEVRGKNPRILKSGRMPAEVYQQLWQTITAGQEWRGELHNRKKNGELYWEYASISPVMDTAGRIAHFLAVKEDITEHKRLEARFLQAQKMEAIGLLAGGVAHDFNNILTAMLLRLDAMKHDAGLVPTLREDVKEIESCAQRAAGLTRQLLLFGRRSVMTLERVDLNEVVDNLLKMLRRLIGEDIKLRFEACASLPGVDADVGMLEQVLMNLAVNARDAMPKGGRLTLATEVVEVDAASARRLPEAQPGRFVCLSVTDAGCGMDEETLSHLFEPFFTTKAVGKGTGLGLATAYGIVSQHGGWITADSELGKGSTFRVFLPATAKPAAEPAAEAQPAQGGKETILVVEDDPAVRTMLSLFLRRWGYRVLEASMGVEALACWQKHASEVDLLFTDMVMPEGMTGLELAEKLRLDRPDLKVIVSSGYSAELTEPSGLAAARITYVPKPCLPDKLATEIRRCLDGVPSTAHR